MSRSILSALLALLLCSGIVMVSKADVTGSFDIDITLTPEGTQTESVKFEIDLQSNLIVNVTLSGLTFGADLGFGNTGVEFAILSLTTNLGALAIHDDFVFATPFGCTDFSQQDSSGQCLGQFVFPLSDQVGFVKKRVEMELNIAGITLTNLAIFEDVDFPDINGSGFHEHDHYEDWAIPGKVYYVGQNDAVVDNQTPTYGFGDVIMLSGQTVSGITVTGSTTFCASGRNYIKKRSWPYEVNKACTSALGGLIDPIEGGAKTPLLFEEETLSIEGIELGGVTIDIHTNWHPNEHNGFFTVINASFSVLDLADVSVALASNDITILGLDEIDIVVSSGNLTLVLVDFGGDLSIDVTLAVLSVVLNPNQNPADLTVQILAFNGVGVVEADFSLGVSRGPLSLDTTTVFANIGGPGLDWVSTSFSLSVDTGSGISFGAEFSYTPAGMGQTTIELGVVF